MSIQFHCDHCRKLVKAPEALGGKRAKCPKCGSIVEVPLVFPEDEDLLAGFDEFMEKESCISSKPIPPPIHSSPLPQPVQQSPQITSIGTPEKKQPNENSFGIAILAAILGSGIGFFAAHHFPFFGGIALMGDPYSPARQSLVPGHMLFCGSLLGILFYAASRQMSFGFVAMAWMVLLAVLFVLAFTNIEFLEWLTTL